MNEVEKMYENAGIEPRCNIYPTFYDCVKYPHEKCEDCVEWGYPPFTAEKQLLLIQWLAETRPIHINLLLDKWTIEGMVRYGIKYDTFEDALSGYINQIWQDLTEAEKAEIKNILESEVRE